MHNMQQADAPPASAQAAHFPHLQQHLEASSASRASQPHLWPQALLLLPAAGCFAVCHHPELPSCCLQAASDSQADPVIETLGNCMPQYPASLQELRQATTLLLHTAA